MEVSLKQKHKEDQNTQTLSAQAPVDQEKYLESYYKARELSPWDGTEQRGK